MTTAACSADPGIARKNEATVLHALARMGQVGVAEAMGVSESTVSRYKNGELAQWCSFLAALGLKCVPAAMKCYDPKEIDAVLLFARRHLNDMKDAEQLSWEDPE